ncbi:MAG: SRPBCC domain-containing protein [Chitinophagaceae bacterium]|nr:SRPBCC domain-containing protein [Chitinophagaceae bacterium]
MEKQQHRITINAPKEKVWTTLWDLNTYNKWTSAFSESSNVQTDNWKKGSKVLFTDGTNNGMVSRIDENIPNEFMSFEHLGEMRDGIEDTTSERVAAWKGAHENYTLKETNGKTDLLVEIDISDEYAQMFAEMWPKALNKVKDLSER